MNWEDASLETLKRFDSLIQLLIKLNELNDPKHQKSWFTWNFSGTRMYISGIPSALASLLSLLWSHTEHYAFYMFQEDGSCMIEVIYF